MSANDEDVANHHVKHTAQDKKDVLFLTKYNHFTD